MKYLTIACALLLSVTAVAQKDPYGVTFYTAKALVLSLPDSALVTQDTIKTPNPTSKKVALGKTDTIPVNSVMLIVKEKDKLTITEVKNPTNTTTYVLKYLGYSTNQVPTFVYELVGGAAGSTAEIDVVSGRVTLRSGRRVVQYHD